MEKREGKEKEREKREGGSGGQGKEKEMKEGKDMESEGKFEERNNNHVLGRERDEIGVRRTGMREKRGEEKREKIRKGR